MTNKEKIDNFMSQLDNSWGDLKKVRYICIKLCEIYEYDPQYAYGTEEGKIEYMNNIFGKMYSEPEETRYKTVDYEDSNKICINLFQIFKLLVEKAGIPQEKYSILGSEMIFTDDDGTTYRIKPVDELFCVKTKSSPKGFVSTNTENTISLSQFKNTYANPKIEQIDRELGFIGEDGYVGDIENITDEQEVTEDSKVFFKNVKDVLQKGKKYLESIISTKIQNVELHRYYKYLLKTAFPNNYCIVKPLSAPDLEDIKYVVLARINDKTNECISFLYNESDNMFHRKTINEIKGMINELGLSDVGKKDIGIIDNLYDTER